MIGHLGTRVSALLDGQLSPEETERAWAHVHSCHTCRDLVEREGWVKTQLAALSFDGGRAPDSLLGSLRTRALDGDALWAGSVSTGSDPRRAGLVALGGGAAAAVLGMLALGLGSSDAPTRTPVTQVTTPSATTPAVTTPSLRQRVP